MRVVVALLLVCSTLANAEIYKWTDKDGNVHYGDSPKKGVVVEALDIDVQKTGTKMATTSQRKKWVKQAVKSSQQKKYQKKARQAPSKKKKVSYDCDYARDRLRYYEFEWDKRRTRGYKQRERNYYKDKISFYKSEIRHEC